MPAAGGDAARAAESHGRARLRELVVDDPARLPGNGAARARCVEAARRDMRARKDRAKFNGTVAEFFTVIAPIYTGGRVGLDACLMNVHRRRARVHLEAVRNYSRSCRILPNDSAPAKRASRSGMRPRTRSSEASAPSVAITTLFAEGGQR